MTPCPKCKAVMTVDFQVPYCVRCERATAPAQPARLWTIAPDGVYGLGQLMNCTSSLEVALFAQRIAPHRTTLTELALCAGTGEPTWHPLVFPPEPPGAPVGHTFCALQLFPDEPMAMLLGMGCGYPKAIVLSGAQVRR